MTTPAETLATAIMAHAIATKHGLTLIAEAIDRATKGVIEEPSDEQGHTPLPHGAT